MRELLYRELENWERSKVVSKVWGYEVWFFNTDKLCMKQLVIYPGRACSNHYHQKKYEIFICVDSGPKNQLFLTVDGKEELLRRGQHVIIHPGVHHTFRVEGSEPAALLEFSTHHLEDDSYRLSSSHKIAGGYSMDFLGDVEKFIGCRVLCIGDIALDCYVTGKVERISPEAPCPVLLEAERTSNAGCVGNVATNVVALGGNVAVVAIYGDDFAGIALESDMKQQTIETCYLVESNRPTSEKTRFMSGSHHIVRVDKEIDRDISGELESRVVEKIETAILEFKPDVIYMADYDKGVLTPHVIAFAIDKAKEHEIPTIADPKLKHFLNYRGVTVLKPNDVRAGAALELPVETDSDIKAIAHSIISNLNCENLLLTRGGKGMYLQNRGNETTYIPARFVEVSELSGAGDTAGATLALGVGAGLTVKEAAEMANVAASLVVQQAGTATCTPSELAAALQHG